MSVGWDVKMVPRVKDNKPLGISLDFEEQYRALKGRSGNFQISKLITLTKKKTIVNYSLVYFSSKQRYYGTLIYYGKTMVLWGKQIGTILKTMVLH